MMKVNKLTENIISEIVDRIVTVASPGQIILFGSYADGTADMNSDVDLIVIKPGVKSRIKEYSRIRRSLKGIRFPFDIVVMSPEEYEYYSINWENSIIAEAREKGTILYGGQGRAYGPLRTRMRRPEAGWRRTLRSTI